MIEGLGRSLGDVLARAVCRARAKPLTRDDVDRLASAHDRFLSVIAELQDRDDPPDPMPRSESGATRWSNWIAANQIFGFKRGRRESSDWRLIGALLALYETVSGVDASAAQADGPTMRYLATALAALADYAPADARNHFHPPNVEALRKQLPELRECYLGTEKRALAGINLKAAGE